MLFPIITKLKWKGSSSTSSSSQSPLSLPNLECEGGPTTCSIDSLNQSFDGTIFIGSVAVGVVVSAIITRQLVSWYVEGSKNTNVLWWRLNATRFLRGKWTRDKVGWGDLPIELWAEIGKRMVSQLDIVYFRCACKKLRLSLPSPARFPLRLPPPPSCDAEFRNIPYSISEVTVYVEEGAWDEVYMQVDQGRLFRVNPFLSVYADEVDFCKASILASRRPKLSQLSFFAKSYFPCMTLDSHKLRHRKARIGFPRKSVLICSPNAYGVNLSYARASDLSVVSFMCGEGIMQGRLALLRLGGPPEEWTWDTDFCTRVFVSIAAYKGQLCTLASCGRVFLMDYNSFQFTQICDPFSLQLTKPLSVPMELKGKSLFEARGDLYLSHIDADFILKHKAPMEFYNISLRLKQWVKFDHMGRCSEAYIYLGGLSL